MIKEVLSKQYNENSKVPKYLKIRGAIKYTIDNGFIKVNEMLPTEIELCEVFNVSRMTVRQAIDELTREGYLESRIGSGTFVKALKLSGGSRLIRSFSDEISLLEKKALIKLIGVEVIEPNRTVVNELQLPPHVKEVLQIKRVRYVEEDPISYQVTYLPYPKFAGLLEQDFEKNSLYDLLLGQDEYSLSHGTENINALIMDEYVAHQLECKPNIACFLLTRTVFAKEYEKPIEYAETYLRGDRFIFSNKLTF